MTDQAEVCLQLIARLVDCGQIAAVNGPDEAGMVSLTFTDGESDDLYLGGVGEPAADAALAHRGLEA